FLSTCQLVSFFFFSSRRRHTRLQGDWSSDVCSSDLPQLILQFGCIGINHPALLPPRDGFCCGQCHRPQRPETTTETTWQTQAVGNSSKLHPPSTQAKKGFNQLIRSPQPGILPSHRDILKVPPVPNVCATAVA